MTAAQVIRIIAMMALLAGWSLLPAAGQAASGQAVVDSAQETCFDATSVITCPAEGEDFYGQDAQFHGEQPAYVDNGDGTVTDSVTGLVWQQSPDTDGDGDIDSQDKLTFDEAQSYCGALSLGGANDWRLPSISELYTLYDARGTDPMVEGDDTSGLIPFIDTDYFDFAYGDTSAGERIIDAQYGSSTQYVAGGKVFGVNFADGRIKGYGFGNDAYTKTFYTACVRGDEYGVRTFVDNGDGTVSDEDAGLMWPQADSGTGLDWQEALAWVQQMNEDGYLGYSDWRLPNIKELQSIVDYSRSPDTTGTPAIDDVFDCTQIVNEGGEADYPFYWSSTTHKRFDGSGFNAAYVAFGRALGYMRGVWMDVHGAGSQRSDPKAGDPTDYPYGLGPQGDAVRIYNYVRLVRDLDEPQSQTSRHLPFMLLLLGS